MGTEEFWVPAVLAAVGTGASYVNQQQANSKQQAGEVSAIQNQEALSQKANAETNALTQQIAKNTPQQIAAKETGNYVQQLRANAAGSTLGGSTTGGGQSFGASSSSLAPSVGGSSRYNSDKASAQTEVENYGNTYANEMGAIDAATRMRTNEGLAMGTLGTQLNSLQGQSYGQNFVDQLRAQVAGQGNPWLSLASGLVSNAAKAYSINAGGAKNPYLGAANGTGGVGTPGSAVNYDPGNALA